MSFTTRIAIASVLSLLMLFVGAAEAGERKPNVIVFLSDDVGYGEYGFQGNKAIGR